MLYIYTAAALCFVNVDATSHPLARTEGFTHTHAHTHVRIQILRSFAYVGRTYFRHTLAYKHTRVCTLILLTQVPHASCTRVQTYTYSYTASFFSFSRLCPKYTIHTRTRPHYTLGYCFLCLRWSRILHIRTEERARARTHAYTHTRTAFFYLPTLVPQHTLTFTLTHSELTHARSLCYELTDATEIIIINESHGVALFFFSFFLVVCPVGGGGGCGGRDSNVSTLVCRFRPLQKQSDMLYITCMTAGTN